MYKVIEVKQSIFEDNNKDADLLRQECKEKGVFLLNIMSSPGSGKTTTLSRTIETIKDEVNIGVMEADIDSDVDAHTISQYGVRTIQLHTGGMCHLDADMTRQGLHELGMENLDLAVLENVGNLVCPASYDLGQHLNVVLLSVTEGSDKPQKYPVMFKKADLVIISKADLAHHFDFDVEEASRECKKLNPKVDILILDSKTGKNLELWYQYLRLKKELF